MTLRLTDDEIAALRSAAAACGISRQEYARAAIREKTAAWAAQRDSFLAEFVVTNKGLLDRLGQ